MEGHRTRNHSYCSILYTPISIPYKAYTGALLYYRWKCWGAAGSHKSKHLEYTAYFWKGNINNLAHFSWIITLSPPDLCFYPTGGLYKPCFYSNPWCIQVLAAVKLPDQLQGNNHSNQLLLTTRKIRILAFKFFFTNLYSLTRSPWMSLQQVL